MKKTLWFTTVIFSMTLAAAVPLQEQLWRAEIEKALYAVDRSEMVILEDGSEAISKKALKYLETTLASSLAFNGNAPTEEALSAAGILAKYRRHYKEQRDLPFRSWDPQKVTFYFAHSNSDGNHVHALGYGSRVLTPGMPFSNGSLLAFTRDRYWFEDENGHIYESEITQLPVDSSRTLDIGEVYLVAQVERESQVFNAVIDALGPQAIYVGDPKPLNGEFYASDLKSMLNKLASERDAIVHPKSDQIFVFDSKKSMESYKDQGGNEVMVKNIGELANPGQLQETVERAMNISKTAMEAYDNVVNNYAARLAEDDKKVNDYAHDLVVGVLEEYGEKGPDYKRLHGFLHKTLHWFNYESDEQEALVMQRIENAFRVLASEQGPKGKLAARMADALAEKQ